jgi:hypothetical protein
VALFSLRHPTSDLPIMVQLFDSAVHERPALLQKPVYFNMRFEPIERDGFHNAAGRFLAPSNQLGTSSSGSR